MSVEAARQYVERSNQGLVDACVAMFAEDATYASTQVGTFEGREAIAAMMRSFFARYPGANWEVEEYKDRGNGGIEFDFVMTATDAKSGNFIERKGTERIVFDLGGKIHSVAVEVR